MADGDAAANDETKTRKPGRDGMAGLRRATAWALGAAVLLFLYFVAADRTTPFAGDARVQAFVLRVAPEVGGRVVRVGVTDNAVVDGGAELFTIDTEPYELAVAQAQARLDQAGQAVGADTASVDAAAARVEQARAAEQNVRAQTARILELVAKGVYAKAREDDAIAAIDEAAAAVATAEADLVSAKEALGPQGAKNRPCRRLWPRWKPRASSFRGHRPRPRAAAWSPTCSWPSGRRSIPGSRP